MVAHVPMDQPCGECEWCSSQISTLEDHPATFEVLSNSHIDGINFKKGKFTTNQIADAFANLIPDHMDWQIKKNALERWNALLPGLLEGPELRESEFDLQPVYRLLDDLLFLRALQETCVVEWVDEPLRMKGDPKVGWVETEYNIRGPPMRICMVRPSPELPRSVHYILGMMMHEMCHALLYLACECSVCSCELNLMNGPGMTGHGPNWQRVRAAAEETANLHLKGLAEPFLLAHWSEPDLRQEGEARVKLLGGLYEKVTREDNEVEREKKVERDGKRAVERKNTRENDQKKVVDDETVAYVVAMFEASGRQICTNTESETGKGGSTGW